MHLIIGTLFFYLGSASALYSSAMQEHQHQHQPPNPSLGHFVFEKNMGSYFIKYYENEATFQKIKEISGRYSPIQFKSNLPASETIEVGTTETKIVIPKNLTENIVLKTIGINDCTVITLWDPESHKTGLFHFSSMQYEHNIEDANHWITSYLQGIKNPAQVEAHLISSFSNYLAKAIDLLKRNNILNIKGLEVDYVLRQIDTGDYVYDPQTVEIKEGALYSKSTHINLAPKGKSFGINSINGDCFR